MSKKEVFEHFKEDSEKLRYEIFVDFICILLLITLCIASWMIWNRTLPILKLINSAFICNCVKVGYMLWACLNFYCSLALGLVLLADITAPQLLFWQFRYKLNENLWSDYHSLGLHARMYDGRWIAFDKYRLFKESMVVLRNGKYKEKADYILQINSHLKFMLTKEQYKCMKRAQKDDTKPIIIFDISELEYIGEDYDLDGAIERDIFQCIR